MEKNVSVVIPNYNGEALLSENLPRILDAANKKENKILEIIVVDDASTDMSVSLLDENFPEVRCIRHKKNKRFSAAVNTGCRMAKGDFVCLLNSDVCPSPLFLKSIFRHFEDKDVFGVSLSEKGYSWAKGFFKNGYVEHMPGSKTTKPHETFWVSGGSGVFRRDIWMKLKGLDEELFPPFYWEDLDICYRAMKRGYKLIWEPQAFVSHEHESTNKLFNSTYKRRIEERNQLLFIWRNITSPNLFRKHIRALIARSLRHPGYIRIVLMALMKYRAVYKLRKIEKKQATVSDESIFARF